MSATPTKRLLLVLCILWGGNSGFYQRNQSTVPSLMSLFVNESQLASADADKANVIQPSTPCHTISAWTGDFGGVREVGGWAGQMLGSNEGRASCPEWLHINMESNEINKMCAAMAHWLDVWLQTDARKAMSHSGTIWESNLRVVGDVISIKLVQSEIG